MRQEEGTALSFVVKKMCYLDKNGNGVISPEFAYYHEDRETAELVARTCGGEVFKTIKPERKKTERKSTSQIVKPIKKELGNQAWMRGAK